MNPYAIITLIIAWLASLAGVGYWQNEAGHVAERTDWQTRENTELRTVNEKIKSLEETARKAEQDKAEALASVATDYERKLSDANKLHAADRAAVRDGAIRMRDPGAAGLRSCGSIAAETAAGAGQRDGRATGEFSAAASGFLLDLANDADDVARQLAACQSVVAADRQ